MFLLNDLTPAVAPKFAEYGFASATTANLQARIDAIETARTQQYTGKGSGIASTAETKTVIKRIRTNSMRLKEVGENIVEELGDDVFAEWRAACKIEKRETEKNNNENPPPELVG